jgi:2,3-bisphosphoglycerate-independent phosphoglycerate mutase
MFITLTEYETNLPVTVAFQPDKVTNPVAKVVSDAGFKQLHIAETEKYAHVTFFFNGGTEEQFPGEDRVLIPSPRVTSYDQQPAMSAVEITDRLLEEIDKKTYQFMVVNFANADMVGHTGNLPATIQAIQALDTQLGRIAEKVLSYQGTLVITADHGNAEEMLKVQTGEIDKEHSINPVPFFIVNQWWAGAKPYWPPVAGGDLSQLRPLGILSDVGPTLLRLMGLPVPPDMSGHSIV